MFKVINREYNKTYKYGLVMFVHRAKIHSTLNPTMVIVHFFVNLTLDFLNKLKYNTSKMANSCIYINESSSTFNLTTSWCLIYRMRVKFNHNIIR